MIQGYYEEVDWNDNVLIKKLDKMIDVIGYDMNKVSKTLYKPTLTISEALYRVSPQVLEELKKKGDRQVATEDCNILKFNNINYDGLTTEIGIKLAKKINKFGVSGKTWYPANGYMGWHTNSNNQGYRLYCSFVKEKDKSFFRYCDPVSNEIHTSWDKQGWNFRIFKIDSMLWHSVFSETDRFSIGYALYV